MQGQGQGQIARHICLLPRKAQHELSIFPYGFSQPQPQQAVLLHLKLPLPRPLMDFTTFALETAPALPAGPTMG